MASGNSLEMITSQRKEPRIINLQCAAFHKNGNERQIVSRMFNKYKKAYCHQLLLSSVGVQYQSEGTPPG